MSALYAPELYYLCDDPDCCWNGSPRARCRYCHELWPCPDFIANHTEARVRKEIRWIDRKWVESGDGEDFLTYMVDCDYERLTQEEAR